MNEPIIDLSKNEFYFPHPVVTKAMPQLTAQEICQYQKKPQLVAVLSKYHSVNSDYITLFNGAEHALRSVFAAVSRWQGTALFLPRQGWDYYWKLANDYHVKVLAYDYMENGDTFKLDTDQLKNKIKKANNLVLLLTSPSNPLGCRIEDATLHELASLVSIKGYTIFDNTYANFCEEDEEEASLFEHLESMPKTVIVRSLSKYYGIAGLRVGFAAAKRETLQAFSIQKDYLGFNAFSDAFAVRCLYMQQEFQKVTRQIVSNRRRLSEIFTSSSGFKPFKSSANFILVRVPDETYTPFLFERGIKIKPFSNGELKNCVRIAVPPLCTVKRIEEATNLFCAQKEIA